MILAEPLDGAGRITGEVDVSLVARGEQLNAQAVGVDLHIIVVATSLRGKRDDIVLIHDGVYRAPLLLDARCMWMELVVDGWSGLSGTLRLGKALHNDNVVIMQQQPRNLWEGQQVFTGERLVLSDKRYI